MRFISLILFFFFLSSCVAQNKISIGILTGKADIGPLCPQEPCNPTPARLKQIYDSYQVVIMDTAAEKILFKIPIRQDATFNMKLPPGQYVARIKPVLGEGFRSETIRISVKKGKTTDISLTYDTGLR